MPDREKQERVARNEATFRKANEQIESVADAHGLARSVPFVCECADISCVLVVQLTLDEYRQVRADPRRFVVAPGHEDTDDTSVVVGRGDGFDVVEKQQRSGEVAEELADG
ncbi:MAG TPA: hypothetical protein VHC67_07200 [Gaiellaceae bacterium]|nr:hypothetical protein [Gaiellaceae bacterium]